MKHLNLVVVKIILISLATVFGCSYKDSFQPSISPQQVSDQINKDFLIIRSFALESFLNDLIQRLFPLKNAQISIYIAEDSKPFARSFPTERIVVSTSLLEVCSTEAELAFVLAHEIAHILLKHHSESAKTLSPQELKKRELEADSVAVNAIMQAGYGLNGALNSIQRLTSIWDFYGYQGESGYPAPSERVSYIYNQFINNSCLATGRCILAGLENSREFAKFKINLNNR